MKLRTTAILNLKGGVAKTTTVINLAAILAKDYGKRVLLIDADSQCNCTEFFDAAPALGNLADILRASGDPDEIVRYIRGCIQHTDYPNLDIIPADDSLMDLDLSKVETGSVRINVLRALVEDVCAEYDHILIDCPPAFNAASAAALVAADDVVIPIKIDAFSLRGMSNLTRQIVNMRRINPRLRVGGYLPTMWYNDETIVAAERELARGGLRLYPHIRRTDKVDAMTFAQEPLLVTSPRSAAGVDYRRFAAAYLAQSYD